MTRLQILKGARALLAKRGGWTKDVFARDSNGIEVSSGAPEAVSFCFLGSLERAAIGPRGRFEKQEVAAAESFVFALDPEFDNDAQRTKRPVIALLDRAIAKLEKRACTPVPANATKPRTKTRERESKEAADDRAMLARHMDPQAIHCGIREFLS